MPVLIATENDVVNHQYKLQIERVSVFLLCYYLCCSWYVLFCSTTNRNVDI